MEPAIELHDYLYLDGRQAGTEVGKFNFAKSQNLRLAGRIRLHPTRVDLKKIPFTSCERNFVFLYI